MRISITITVLLLLCFKSSAQDSLSYKERFAMLEAEMDSLSIYSLMSELLHKYDLPQSEINARFSYNSALISAGRSYGISPHSFSSGVAYYHSKGYYADYSGFMNSSFDPTYSLSILSLGYISDFFKSRTLNYSLGYERWHYHGSYQGDLNNALSANLAYNKKRWYLSVDYSYLFGRSSAHRIIGSATAKLKLGEFWIFKAATLRPSASILIGSDEVAYLRVTEDQAQDFQLRDVRIDRFGLDELVSVNILTQNQRDEILQDRRDGLRKRLVEYDFIDREKLSDIYYYFNPQEQEIATQKAFGIMNYSFALPLYLDTKRFSFVLSYSYNIPVQLPGETYSSDPTGYFGASITYRIPLKKKAKGGL